MRKALNDLQKKVATFTPARQTFHAKCEQFPQNCWVVLTAGGEGSRFKKISGDNGVQKSAFILPNGETMIERTIKMYRDFGIKHFTILLYHHADSVTNLLGNGEKYGVSINYSLDPGKPVGRGGAIKNALLTKKIPEGKYLIIHNPDDQIAGDTQKILKQIVNDHLHFEERGGIATVIVVSGTPYSYSGMKVENDLVTDIEMYPYIPVPSHIGMTIFSPAITHYFYELFDLDKKADFESVLFPILKEEKKLFAARIPDESWIPVNDEKGFNALIKIL